MPRPLFWLVLPESPELFPLAFCRFVVVVLAVDFVLGPVPELAARVVVPLAPFVPFESGASSEVPFVDLVDREGDVDLESERDRDVDFREAG